MAEMNIEVKAENVDKLFHLAPALMKRELANALDHISRKFLKVFYAERLSGPPGLTAKRGGIFHRFRRAVIDKSGGAKLLNVHASQSKAIGIIAKSVRNPLDMRVEIKSQSAVAMTFEYGGMITAGTGMMKIPISEEAKNLHGSYEGLRGGIQGLFLLKTRSGRMFLAQKLNGKMIKLHYALKWSIPVTRKLGFYDTWDKLDTTRDDILRQAVGDAVAQM